MASEKDFELLDQYVSNRLNAQDKTAFEKKLASDNSLKSEFNVQQRVVGKIREARVKELKTMFNNVPASSFEAEGTSIATKAVLWVAVVGAVSVGIYFILNDENKVGTQDLTNREQVIREVPVPEEFKQDETPKQQDPAVTKEEKPSEESATPSETDKEEDATVSRAPNGLKSEEEPKAPAPLDVFDPTEETKEPADRKNTEEKISGHAPLTKSSIVVETDSNNKNYSFHYQFRQGKLYLYGTFEKNLYEIMEFFSGNKRTVFLFYKDSYYLLNEENETIKPLAPINDPTLLKKLKDYRGAR